MTNPGDAQDAYGAVSGGLSILMQSDAAMEALRQIRVEPGSDVTLDQILISVLQNWNDFQAIARQRMEGDE